jgi:hypothetical protein
VPGTKLKIREILTVKFKSLFVSSLLVICGLVIGWSASAVMYRGQHAMASFMTSYSALAYLQKGDAPSAMLVLRASAEANILEADKYGDWELWVQSPSAMSKWFSGYESLRLKLPENTRGPVDAEFDSKLNEVLKAAVEKTKTAK